MKDARQKAVEILGNELVRYLESLGIRLVQKEAWDKLLFREKWRNSPLIQADSDTMTLGKVSQSKSSGNMSSP